jgi:hypothetical protein
VDLKAGLDDLEKRKFLTLPGLELRPSVVQPVASRYTDYAISAPPEGLRKLKKSTSSGFRSDDLPACSIDP